MDKWYLVQIKRNKDTITKGVVVKDSLDEAKQGFHAYMGAYAYGNEADTDYVLAQVIDSKGVGWIGEAWEKESAPGPEPEA